MPSGLLGDGTSWPPGLDWTRNETALPLSLPGRCEVTTRCSKWQRPQALGADQPSAPISSPFSHTTHRPPHAHVEPARLLVDGRTLLASTSQHRRLFSQLPQTRTTATICQPLRSVGVTRERYGCCVRPRCNTPQSAFPGCRTGHGSGDIWMISPFASLYRLDSIVACHDQSQPNLACRSLPGNSLGRVCCPTTILLGTSSSTAAWKHDK